MREVFAHEAVLTMESDGDTRAPGAAVTVALCGSWEHEPPCPLAPHHSSAARLGGNVHVRTLFAVEPETEWHVRERIYRALTAGTLTGPDGVTTCWRLLSSYPSAVAEDEAEHAEPLRNSR